MAYTTLEPIIAKHPFFEEMDSQYLSLVVGCASNVRFKVGEFIYRQSEAAEHFFLIRQGRVALEMYIPSRGAITVETLGPGDLLGWSWLFPPYRWQLNALAVELTRSIAFDGACLRGKCDENPSLGYDLMQRFAVLVTRRLQATRLQLMDVYGHPAR